MRSAPLAASPIHPPIGVNTIQEGSFLTLHYRLAGADGADILSTYGGKPSTLSLGAGQLSPALEQRLIGLAGGAHAQFDLAPGEAFGPHNPALAQRVPRAALAELGKPGTTYRLGDVVKFPTPDGQGQYAGKVCALGDDWLEFDFNHPLAGQPVRFEVQVIGVL
jgi:FKBP-type peptidyl-prolyl cis-trans isomerase SlpA